MMNTRGGCIYEIHCDRDMMWHGEIWKRNLSCTSQDHLTARNSRRNTETSSRSEPWLWAEGESSSKSSCGSEAELGLDLKTFWSNEAKRGQISSSYSLRGSEAPITSRCTYWFLISDHVMVQLLHLRRVAFYFSFWWLRWNGALGR